MALRPRTRMRLTSALAALFALAATECRIDLGEDLAGRPCKDGRCLPGYVCRDDVCVVDSALSPGGHGGGGAGGEAGTGIGGSAGSSGAPSGGASPSVDSGAAAEPDAGALDASAPAPDAGPAPPRIGFVPCGEDLCALSSDFCCVPSFPGDERICSPSATGCAWSLGCDGDHDCPGEDVCCASQSEGSFFTRCRATCTAAEPHVECTDPADCPNAAFCCGRFSTSIFSGTSSYDQILCQDTCSGFNDRIVCAVDADCPPGNTCSVSTLYPELSICIP
jgi:hypothetical protein